MKDIKVGVEKIAPSWSKNGLLSAASFVFEIIALNLRLCISFSVVSCKSFYVYIFVIIVSFFSQSGKSNWLNYSLAFGSSEARFGNFWSVKV